MKPLKTEIQDAETLRELGSASVQVVHDLKNQLNGLKLYATFLRKRMEKAERPADELETIAKLIAGLERGANDMTLLVRYGRPLDLRRQPGTDLARLLRESAEGARVETDGGAFEGEFDPALLAEALKSITTGGRASAQGVEEGGAAKVDVDRDPGLAVEMVEDHVGEAIAGIRHLLAAADREGVVAGEGELLAARAEYPRAEMQLVTMTPETATGFPKGVAVHAADVWLLSQAA